MRNDSRSNEFTQNACWQDTWLRRHQWRKAVPLVTGCPSTRRPSQEKSSPCRTSPRTASGNSESLPSTTPDRENPARPPGRTKSAIPSVSTSIRRPHQPDFQVSMPPLRRLYFRHGSSFSRIIRIKSNYGYLNDKLFQSWQRFALPEYFQFRFNHIYSKCLIAMDFSDMPNGACISGNWYIVCMFFCGWIWCLLLVATKL